MSDFNALSRLIFARNRSLLMLWITWIATSATLAIAAGRIFDESYVMPFLCLSIIPAALGAMGMFEVRHTENLMTGESGYSHWMLRMPITTWKLAAAPLLMRFVWIAMLYAVIVAVSGFAGGIWFPIINGTLLFFAGGAWVSALAWRPFCSQRRRLAVIIVTGVLYYMLLMSMMSAHFDQFTATKLLKEHAPLFKAGVTVLILSALVGGVWLAFSSLELARTNSRGLVSETKTKLSGWLGRFNTYLSPDASKVISHRNPRAALAWHDLRRVSLRGERWVLFLTIVALFTGAAFLPLPIANALYVMFLVTQLGAMSGGALLEPTKMRGSSLPTYIAGGPLTCAEIGFTRGMTGVWTSYIGVGLMSVAYFIGMTMPYNQWMLSSWIENTNAFYNDPQAAYRWMALIALAVIAMIPSRVLGFTWPISTGRSRLSLVALIVPILAILSGVGLVTGWFVKQKDFDSATANAWYWTTWIPTILMVLLAIKFLAIVVAANRSLAKQLISIKTVSMLTITWAVATSIVAAIAQWLIPDSRIEFRWILMVTALLLPLGRILVLPYAVYLNRYR